MTDAFIFDHVRTPRGRGKSDGALHEVTPVELASQTLAALRDRQQLDTALVDDVLLGCVTPIGEQGANIARTAVLAAGYAECVAGQQINRFCASGLEAVNAAAAQVMSGQSLAAIGGGIPDVIRKTRDRLAILGLAQADGATRARCESVFANGGVGLWNSRGEPLLLAEIATLNAAPTLLRFAEDEVIYTEGLELLCPSLETAPSAVLAGITS